MLHEEVQLPHQLVAIERDAVRNELIGFELDALTLHSKHELDGLFVQGVVLDRLRDAKMRLERDVAEIFKYQDAEVVGMTGNCRYRQWNAREETAHVHERQRVERKWLVVDREDDRRVIGSKNAEILAGRGVPGERARRGRAVQRFWRAARHSAIRLRVSCKRRRSSIHF